MSGTSGYDALCLLGFGGPESTEEVIPFLRQVTAGRNVPDDRLAEVAKQYELFGGRSPINDQNRALLHALERELAARGRQLPVYFGNRNSPPFLVDTVAAMRDDGITDGLVLATSAFSSFSGCRQYIQDLDGARAQVEGAPRLTKVRLFYNHPGFVDAVEDRVRTTMRPTDRLVFTAHSIPVAMARASEYEDQLVEMATLLASRLDAEFELAYQSRSGPPHVPWLEPDVNDLLDQLARRGETDVCLVPLGFLSDHMEVLFDLDTQAAATARRVGISLVRAPAVGTHPLFVSGLVDIVEEYLDGHEPRWVGTAGPWPRRCPEGHCIPARSH